MPKQPKAANPFYVLLVIVGVVFVVTACAYGVMTVKMIDPARSATADAPLIQFLDQHGFTLLMVQLVLLAIATFAAIGTDEYWTRRAARSDHSTVTHSSASQPRQEDKL